MGDLHRVIKARDRKFSDPEVEKLLRIKPEDIRLKSHEISFFTRPAYYGTKAQVKDVIQNI